MRTTHTLAVAALVLLAAVCGARAAAPARHAVHLGPGVSHEAAAGLLEAAAEARARSGATPTLKGTRCLCFASRDVLNGNTASPTVHVMAECVRHEAFEDPHAAYRCTCHDVSVQCTHHLSSNITTAPGDSICNGFQNATFPAAPESCDHPTTHLPLCGGAAGLHNLRESSKTVQILKRGAHTTERLQCHEEHFRNPCSAAAPCETDPVDCVTEVGAFGACSHPCGGGSRVAPLTVLVQPKNGGVACPNPLVATERCNLHACPVDCQMGLFGNFSECSVSCGGGTKTRTRPVITQPSGGGAACPAAIDVQPCNTQPCQPTDCQYSPYGECSACSASCGGGTCTRTRTVTANATHGGKACDTATLTKQEPCNEQACPVDCRLGNFSDWSACNATCGAGVQTRTRDVVQEAANGGRPCTGDRSETRACNTHECDVDCEVSAFGPFGPCVGDCGTGTHFRQRNVTRAPAGNGKPCPSLEESAECDTGRPCAEPCRFSEWSNFSACSASCGDGFRTRTRTLLSEPHPDSNCGDLQETEACNLGPCGVDCEWGDWSEFSACDVECGGGLQARTRTFKTHQVPPGKPCNGSASETRECNTHECVPGGGSGGDNSTSGEVPGGGSGGDNSTSGEVPSGGSGGDNTTSGEVPSGGSGGDNTTSGEVPGGSSGGDNSTSGEVPSSGGDNSTSGGSGGDGGTGSGSVSTGNSTGSPCDCPCEAPKPAPTACDCACAGATATKTVSTKVVIEGAHDGKAEMVPVRVTGMHAQSSTFSSNSRVVPAGSLPSNHAQQQQQQQQPAKPQMVTPEYVN